MERQDWDLLFCMFSSTDRMMHTLEEHFTLKALERNFIEMDQVLGTFLKHLPPETTLFVVSDHGFDRFSRQFSVPRWLETEGYWVLPGSASRRTLLMRGLHALKRVKERSSLPDVPFLQWPQVLKPDDLQPPIDWGRSSAICVETGGNWGSLRILKKGQEESRLEGEISEKLSRLTDPDTGRKLVLQVLKGSQLFQGPYQDQMPDLVFELDGVRADFSFHEALLRPESIYHHRRQGVFLAWGRGVSGKTVLSEPAHLTDLAPTVLQLLGLPIARALDGTSLITPPPSTRSPAPIPDYPPFEPEWVGVSGRTKQAPSQDIKDNLRSLGYLQ